jgi:hypothetical protein
LVLYFLKTLNRAKVISNAIRPIAARIKPPIRSTMLS